MPFVHRLDVGGTEYQQGKVPTVCGSTLVEEASNLRHLLHLYLFTLVYSFGEGTAWYLTLPF